MGQTLEWLEWLIDEVMALAWALRVRSGALEFSEEGTDVALFSLH